ncbi:unnamed protein product [Lasius platythorax]|uniref:Uncharacterized protein n=1 Tax=Lasius platythorax TaxID=488582 RepID=A0AAV2P198_9HYME
MRPRVKHRNNSVAIDCAVIMTAITAEDGVLGSLLHSRERTLAKTENRWKETARVMLGEGRGRGGPSRRYFRRNFHGGRGGSPRRPCSQDGQIRESQPVQKKYRLTEKKAVEKNLW